MAARSSGFGAFRESGGDTGGRGIPTMQSGLPFFKSQRKVTSTPLLKT